MLGLTCTNRSECRQIVEYPSQQNHSRLWMVPFHSATFSSQPQNQQLVFVSLPQVTIFGMQQTDLPIRHALPPAKSLVPIFPCLAHLHPLVAIN